MAFEHLPKEFIDSYVSQPWLSADRLAAIFGTKDKQDLTSRVESIQPVLRAKRRQREKEYSAQLNIRVKPAQLATWKKAADAAGIDLASLIRATMCQAFPDHCHE